MWWKTANKTDMASLTWAEKFISESCLMNKQFLKFIILHIIKNKEMQEIYPGPWRTKFGGGLARKSRSSLKWNKYNKLFD